MNRPSADSENKPAISKPPALFLAVETPYPMAGGGPIRTACLLEYLARNFSVHAVFFREPGAPHPGAALPPGLASKVDVIDLPYHSKGEIARLFRTAWRLARNRPPLFDRFSGFEQELAQIVSGREYHLAIVEHFWNAPYLTILRARAKRLVLDLHNVDSAWHHSMAD